jgi:hypothetical protein
MRTRALNVLWCGLICGAVNVAAQTTTVRSPLAACGDEKTTFNVSRGDVGEQSDSLEAGKAKVYIIELFNLQDKGKFGRPTVRHGLDGAWLGATQGFTYISAVIEPGTHHLCSRWQSSLESRTERISLNNFDAVAGKRYYFRAQISVDGAERGGGPTLIDLQPVSEDEGRFLISEAAQSVSKPKK